MVLTSDEHHCLVPGQQEVHHQFVEDGVGYMSVQRGEHVVKQVNITVLVDGSG